ncbi:putative oxidoreductase CzcO [Anatilimnocola aggregata]|uniref:Putative oxidoreductase CzcO n=1 Tax=Anatilimnocola aggregata TaxID=2528021 RepID=A0A517YJ54_9BACT|nr:NAD(P)/FAD-dependent oxidoreductase [Anatilimnocola aggregata]QDU30251.1 putative oxidoreductase CzcO [Anatilimnocola aggregata]
MRNRSIWDCLIVGGGPAGLGVAIALREIGVTRMTILEREEVGASFLRWPREMRLITPSFPTNSVGMLDLNSIAIGTSPGFSLQTEHPTGRQYAAYLQALSDHFELPVQNGVSVEKVEVDDDIFHLQTSAGLLRARSVIWAAGEFQYPRINTFPGAELCIHNSQVVSWAKLAGRERIVIGGYESGLDAAIQLATSGTKVRVLDRSAHWQSEASDPSVTISPFTHDRLRQSQKTSSIELIDNYQVARVDRGAWQYRVKSTEGKILKSGSVPILATGFEGSVRLVRDRFEFREDGFPILTAEDESTVSPGLFLAGPLVRHDQHVFCFIYKFRQRFAVVAKAIGQRLALDTAALENYRRWGMFLDDLSCCGQECVC